LDVIPKFWFAISVPATIKNCDQEHVGALMLMAGEPLEGEPGPCDQYWPHCLAAG
jgi:hypothetical protein